MPELAAMQSTFILSGPGVATRGDPGRIGMRTIAPMLAKTLGVDLAGVR